MFGNINADEIKEDFLKDSIKEELKKEELKGEINNDGREFES